MLNIQRMLVLATSHIRKETDAAITEGGLYDLRYHGATGKDHDLPATMLFPCDTGFYGYVIWVDEGFATMQESENYPDLVAVIAFAKAHGCHWIRFDCDQEPIAELPTYEWA